MVLTDLDTCHVSHLLQIDSGPPEKPRTFSASKPQDKELVMYEKLRQMNLQRADADELVGMLAFGNIMRTTYQKFELSVPDWLDENMNALTREIRARHQDMLEARLKEVRARRETLKTTEERRAALDAEEARIMRSLGVEPPAAA